MESISNAPPPMDTTNLACNLCGRVVPDDLEIFSLCSDCKLLLLQDLATPTRRRRSRRMSMRRRRRRSSHGSSGSETEDFDTESNNTSFSLYRFDTISFSAYGGDDRSVDLDFDSDIDPMRAGLNQWNSDEDDDREWEEADRARYLASPSESFSSIERRFRRRALSEDMDSLLDERGFEQLLEQLAESDNSTRGGSGAPPASIRNLPRVLIVEDHVNKGLVCAICKELFNIGNETTQLPCLHHYHPHCILPWLTSRNSCPLCRRELPTDDNDYEENVSQGGSESDEEYVEVGDSDDDAGVGRGRWLFLAAAAAPVVSIVGLVLIMWLSSNPQRRSRTRRWF